MPQRGLCAAATIHIDNLGILSGLHRGGKKCQQICGLTCGKKLTRFGTETNKKENAKMTLFEKFVMGVNEAVDWLAKEGADLDGRAVATIRAATVRQERLEVYVAKQAATLHRQVENWHDCEELKPK